MEEDGRGGKRTGRWKRIGGELDDFSGFEDYRGWNGRSEENENENEIETL